MVFALVLAGVLLLWMSMIYVTLPGRAPYLPRVYASAFSLEVAFVGVLGAILGMLLASVPLAVAYAMVALWPASPSCGSGARQRC